MNKAKYPTYTIIGAGLAGCFMAILLAKRGYRVSVYERLTKAEVINSASSRSFNVNLYGYGVKALKKVGLWDMIKPDLLMLEGSMTQVTKNAKPIFSPVDRKKMPYYSVARARLVQILLEQANTNKRITFHYQTALLSINRQEKKIIVQDNISKKCSTIACQVVLGADGVNSLVRSFLHQGQETKHTQEYAAWSYKQIIFTKEDVAKLQLRKRVAYTWTRKYAVIAAFPNNDDSLSAMLILPKGKRGFGSLNSASAIKTKIKKEFPDLLPAISAIIPALLTNPEGYYVTIHTDPWYYKDFIAILGDAAHGFLPFFGQGMSAAFGDCLELIRLFDKYGEDWEIIFPLYQQVRKRHMDALGDLSKEGFIRYRRHRKADYSAIYDKLEFMLHALFPRYILPPVFLPVMTDPDHTADYLQNHTKQRKIAGFLGFPLLITALTGVILIQEYLMALYKEVIQSTISLKYS